MMTNSRDSTISIRKDIFDNPIGSLNKSADMSEIIYAFRE